MTNPANPADARRRWFGTFFLFVALGMVIWGQTWLKPRLEGVLFLLYWLSCMIFTFLAILTAGLDFWIVRFRSRQERKKLLKETMQGLDRADREIRESQEGLNKERPQRNADRQGTDR